MASKSFAAKIAIASATADREIALSGSRNLRDAAAGNYDLVAARSRNCARLCETVKVFELAQTMVRQGASDAAIKAAITPDLYERALYYAKVGKMTGIDR